MQELTFTKNGKLDLHNNYLYYKQQLPTERFPANYIQEFGEITEILLGIKSITTLRVYQVLKHCLFTSQLENTLVGISTTVLAREAKVNVTNISKKLKELKKYELILDYSKGIVMLNPRYIWKGNLLARQTLLEQLTGVTCLHNNLPLTYTLPKDYLVESLKKYIG